MAINWTPARLEVDLNYKSKDIVLASEWNNLWKETRLQGNNNTDGIVLLIEIVEGNVTHLTNLDNLFADLESKVTAHTGNSDIHVTSTQKTAWTAKYDKPSGGIPKSDLASTVQSSLEKADTALQQHQDISALTNHVANNNAHVTVDNKTAWNAKYDKPADGIPKTDLASAVQTSLNKADTALQEHQDISDLVSHTQNGNIHVTSEQKTAWNAKYDKPAEGIPKSDLASVVQTSLGKADTALQEHQDISALTNHVANNDIHVTTNDKTAWNSKYNKPSGGIPKTDLASDIQTSLVPSSLLSDAGKVLTVSSSGDAVWAEATPSGSSGAVLFNINVSLDRGNREYFSDKTFDEILSAYNDGKILKIYLSGSGGIFDSYLSSGNRFKFNVPDLRSIVYITSSAITVEDYKIYVPLADVSNEGNVLRVNSSGDPAWTEATSSGSSGTEVFLVTFSIVENTEEIIKDKTYAEIIAAYEAGKIVLCKYLVYGTVSFGQLVDIYSDFNAVIFRVESYTHGSRMFSLLTVNSNNEITDGYFNLYLPTFSQYTILASGWSDGVYSFESDFPSWRNDIEIELDSTATESQVEAWSSAKVTAVFGTNTMKALGDVPTVDIPVIVKKVVK